MMKGYRLSCYKNFNLGECSPSGIVRTVSLGDKTPVLEEFFHNNEIRGSSAQIEPLRGKIKEETNPQERIEEWEKTEWYDSIVEAGWGVHYLYKHFEKYMGIANLRYPDKVKEIKRISGRLTYGYISDERSVAPYMYRAEKNIVQIVVVRALLATHNPNKALVALRKIPTQEYRNSEELFLKIISFLEGRGFKGLNYLEPHLIIKNTYWLLSKFSYEKKSKSIPLDLKREITSGVLNLIAPDLCIYTTFDLYQNRPYVYISAPAGNDPSIIIEEYDDCELAQLYHEFIKRLPHNEKVITLNRVNDFVEKYCSKLWDFFMDGPVLEYLQSNANEKCHKCNTIFSEKPFKTISKSSVFKIKESMEEACQGYSQWLMNESCKIAEPFIRNPEIRSELKKTENYLLDFRYEKERKILTARDPNTSKERLSKLAENKNRNVRIGVAKNPNTPNEILYKLVGDGDPKVRREVAKNPNIPNEVLYKLVRDDDPEARIGVANNPNTPNEILYSLTEDCNPRVRKAVASNPNTPDKILSELAKETDPHIRIDVANNPNTIGNTLSELAEDIVGRVRIGAAKNPNTPEEVLYQLAKDDYEVRKGVAKNLNTPKEILSELAKDIEWHIRMEIAKNLNTPKEILSELAKDIEWHIRMEIAKNLNTTSETLSELAEDDNWGVRKGVANNPNTLDDILVKLAEDEDERVRIIAQDRLSSRKTSEDHS